MPKFIGKITRDDASDFKIIDGQDVNLRNCTNLRSINIEADDVLLIDDTSKFTGSLNGSELSTGRIEMSQLNCYLGVASLNSVTQDKTLAEISFVSTTGGSEDLHIDADSDCVDAGVDLGTTNGVEIDINGRNRDSQGDTWDIGAHEFVADSTASTAFIMFVD